MKEEYTSLRISKSLMKKLRKKKKEIYGGLYNEVGWERFISDLLDNQNILKWSQSR